VLLLSRVTGEGVTGATFDNRVFSQLDGLAKMIKGKNITLDIQVAGGVRRKHLQDLVCAGVSSIAFGSGLYKADDMAMEAQAMRDEITKSYKKLD
jgi:ribulose-phosphate 3-epimerase